MPDINIDTGAAPSTNTGTTGTSSSSSSSRSSGTSAAAAAATKNAVATWSNLLLSWRIELTPQIQAFVRRAASQGWSSAVFLQEVRRQRFYMQRFPGILGRNGVPRMTEAQYWAGYNSAKDYAATVGRSLSVDAYGLAVKNGNSPSEIRAKVQALDTLKTNRAVFGQFGDYLNALGLAPKGGLKKGDLLQFVMGQGPKAWEQAWTTANAAAQIERAGLDVGRPKQGGDIGYRGLVRLEKQMLPGDQVDYKGLAEAVHALPASELYGAGITKKDILKMAFGVKGAENIADRVRGVLATYQARFEPQGTPQLNQGGLQTGQTPRQASE